MKIGIITDIHNNMPALNAVLDVFDEKGCEGILCGGDIVGIGPYPEEAVTAVRRLENLLGCVRGNHEDYLLAEKDGTMAYETLLGKGETEYCKWEHTRLSEDSERFLDRLPYEQYLELAGRKIYISHYSMDGAHRYNRFIKKPEEKDLENMFPGTEADIIIYGHDHEPNVVKGKRWYINCGAAGCPGPDKNVARAGLLTLGEEIAYEPVRVVYEADKTVAAIDRLGYPDKENIKKFFFGV